MDKAILEKAGVKLANGRSNSVPYRHSGWSGTFDAPERRAAEAEFESLFTHSAEDPLFGAIRRLWRNLFGRG